MKVLFMGTPDFAAASLKKLIEDKYEICGVFTQPDKPKNRGMKLEYSPVKQVALEAGISVYQPAKMRDGEAFSIISGLKPDIIIVVAYGRILPKEILDIPPLGCINIHGSLLPKYRGSAPIQWAVLNGEKETGVTSMYLAEEMDAGDMIFKDVTAIGSEETSGELFDRLMVMGAELLIRTLKAIESGTAPRIPQNHEEATFAPMICKEMCPICWEHTGSQILSQIHGLLPWPVATTEINGTCFKIFSASFSAEKGEPGKIIGLLKNGLEIACKDGSIIITELQAPGGKRMKAADYFRGHPLCL